jgi:drug/metabolite transporter (DMT)-like permease
MVFTSLCVMMDLKGYHKEPLRPNSSEGYSSLASKAQQKVEDQLNVLNQNSAADSFENSVSLQSPKATSPHSTLSPQSRSHSLNSPFGSQSEIALNAPQSPTLQTEGTENKREWLKMLKENGRIYAALTGTQMCYAAYHVSSEIAQKDGSNPIQVALFRNLFAILPMFLLAFKHSKTSWKLSIDRKDWARLFIVSLLVVPGSQAMTAAAVNFVPATVTSVLQLLVPVFSMVIAVLQKDEKLGLNKEGAMKVSGLSFAILGAVIMIGIDKLSSSHVNGSFLIGVLLSIWTAFNQACFINFSRKLLKKYDSSKIVFWIAAIGATSLVILGTASGQISTAAMAKISYISWICYVIAALLASATAEVLITWANARTSSVVTSVFFVALPLAAAILSLIIFGELWTAETAGGATLLLAGLMLVCWAKYRDKLQASNKVKMDDEFNAVPDGGLEPIDEVSQARLRSSKRNLSQSLLKHKKEAAMEDAEFEKQRMQSKVLVLM